MNKTIFDYGDYKSYLSEVIGSKPRRGRGVRIALARALGAPVSHVSQVLGGKSHLSLEQAEGVNAFLGHTDEEAEFFLLLIQLTRAGTPALRKRLEIQLGRLREKRLVLKDRLGIQAKLSADQQATFYSSWVYGAVHVMLSIEKFQTKEAVSRHLGISLKRINEVIEFLESVGLAVRDDQGKYGIGTTRIHLGSDSPLISKFHTNWRMKAIQSLEKEDAEKDLHYSSAITIAEADVLRIHAKLVDYIQEIKAIVRDSKEEGVHCFSLDFFRI